MKICGIICEYNPFHNGHLKQIEFLKNEKEFDFVVCVMSGNFSQRATPSVLDKYTKTKCIEKADLVVNMPTAYSINNAEVFALSGMKIFNDLGVDNICFGVEDDNLSLLNEIADFILNENESLSNNIKIELKKGNNYKTSLLNAISLQNPVYNEILSKPNNLLAVEYLKAIKITNSKINPILIKRENNFSKLSVVDNFMSATAIRNLLTNNDSILNYVPDKTNLILKENYVKDLDEKYQRLLYNNILNYDIDKLKNTYMVSEGIENKILKALENSNNYSDFTNLVISKRYDKNKINRILLNYILGIDKKTIEKLYSLKHFKYIKVLSFSPQILSHLNSKTNLIIRKKDIEKVKFNSFDKKLNDIENKANLLYNSLMKKDFLKFNDLYIPALKINQK